MILRRRSAARVEGCEQALSASSRTLQVHRQQPLQVLVELAIAPVCPHHGKNPLICTVERKPVMAFPNRLPRPEIRRQIPPRRPSPEPPRDPFENQPMSANRRPRLPTSDGISGAATAQNSSDITPICVMRQIVTANTPHQWETRPSRPDRPGQRCCQAPQQDSCRLHAILVGNLGGPDGRREHQFCRGRIRRKQRSSCDAPSATTARMVAACLKLDPKSYGAPRGYVTAQSLGRARAQIADRRTGLSTSSPAARPELKSSPLATSCMTAAHRASTCRALIPVLVAEDH